MSTRFTFTNDSVEPISIDDSPLDSADDCTSTATYDDGNVHVELSADYIDHINVLGTLRNKSSGGFGVTHADLSDEEVNHIGMAGEAGLHHAYDEWTLDEEIYEGRGDGGIDGFLRLDGELCSVDVKTPTYAADPWLKVEAKMVDHKSPEDRADVYVVATVTDGTVTYHGWVYADEVIDENNKRTSRKPGATHQNYVLEGGFRDMPPLPNDFTFSA